MSWFIARSPNNKVKSVSDDNGMDEIYRFFDDGWTIYRLEAHTTPGQFLMIPQTLTGITTTPVTVDGTLTDA